MLHNGYREPPISSWSLRYESKTVIHKNASTPVYTDAVPDSLLFLEATKKMWVSHVVSEYIILSLKNITDKAALFKTSFQKLNRKKGMQR